MHPSLGRVLIGKFESAVGLCEKMRYIEMMQRDLGWDHRTILQKTDLLHRFCDDFEFFWQIFGDLVSTREILLVACANAPQHIVEFLMRQKIAKSKYFARCMRYNALFSSDGKRWHWVIENVPNAREQILLQDDIIFAIAHGNLDAVIHELRNERMREAFVQRAIAMNRDDLVKLAQ